MDLTVEERHEVVMKHAKKMCSVARLETRPILKGALHKADGTIMATDSHRYIMVEQAHSLKEEKVISTVDGEILDGSYPDLTRLIPEGYEHKITFYVKKAIEAHKVIQSVTALQDGGRAKKDAIAFLTIENAKEVNISGTSTAAAFKWCAGSPITTSLRGKDAKFKLAYKAEYMLQALQLFKDLGVDMVEVDMLTNTRTFLVTNYGVKAAVGILPVRVY
ncbi:hypothetical protein U2I54_16250 [Bacillus pseudomycoides]|uniref:DNA polymerase III beta sliding clamp central domain-containing protein n=1 Tax=Bacillus bingmayongensis TaxID=1150157 RepID=A0ABU5JYR7_9BACI|nr:hypothetical protein [Bacillus pseudomycoides]